MKSYILLLTLEAFPNKLKKKENEFYLYQSHQLRTAMFIQSAIAKFLYHSLKISILLRHPAQSKPDNFLKSKPEPGPKSPSSIDNSEQSGHTPTDCLQPDKDCGYNHSYYSQLFDQQLK